MGPQNTRKNQKKEEKRLTIRNSTAEFLVFTSQAGENGIEVRVEDENVWLTQKLIAKLFDVEVNTINYHLKEIFKTGELESKATIRKFRIVQKEVSGRTGFLTDVNKGLARE